ncbi:MAG TPA: redox-sensitive transcriptional activator SoxR [Opitutaceae bacterium]|jgi:MerR family redox-sensitive transcriptional activator SoxR
MKRSQAPAAPPRSGATEFQRELTVGEVAARAGIAVSAVRFYESQGLLLSWRSAGNQRRYPREALRRVSIIKVAQRLGIPLASIKAALDSLPRGRTPTDQDWSKISARWHAALDERIARLTQLRDHLTGCIGCGCLSLKSCPLRNPWDKLAAEGPGPRLLEPDP